MAERTFRGRGRQTPYSRPEEQEADPCSVFVGNLPYEVTWRELKDHMRQAGDVLRADVMEAADGRSVGTGLVKYGSVQDAEWAIANLTDTDLSGRPIFVRADRGGRGGGRGKGFDSGKGSSRGRGGRGGRGRGRDGGKPTTASDLDSDLDAYMTGSGAPSQMKARAATNLDDDLDAYFSQGSKSKKTPEPPSAEGGNTDAHADE